INIVQIILATLLVGLVLLQGKGVGLSQVFGGTGNIYRTKRGAEKFLHITTIIVSLLFFGMAFFNILY
ncbi:MAG: preprotein translocase subunit SecG, partial [Parcubacteria group bacterium]|nr:preprotein translocase subunit SecG [Parcubacteria group bacterium]